MQFARIFDHLAYFEMSDPGRRRDYNRLSKMHRRRIQATKTCLDERSTDKSIDELKEYQQACSEMLDCKLKLFEMQQSEAGRGLAPKLLQKMAYYCTQGIKANSLIIGEFPSRHSGQCLNWSLFLSNFLLNNSDSTQYATNLSKLRTYSPMA